MQINETTKSNKIDYKNQEYLGLYCVVDACENTNGKECLWVNSPERDDTYVEYGKWLRGTNPYKHRK